MEQLTARELEVLIDKANGLQSKEIAAHSNLHRRTIEVHLHNAKMKLGARTVVHAVALAMRNGIISASQIGVILLLCWSGLFDWYHTERDYSQRIVRAARRELATDDLSDLLPNEIPPGSKCA